MKIGMIVAIMSEMKQLLNKYGSSMTEIKKNGYTIYHCQLKGNDIYVAQSGAGEIGAAAVAQLLITAFDVELIVNYGVVGGLTDESKLSETTIVKDIVHYAYDTSEYDHCEVGRYLEFESVHIPTTEKYVDLALRLHPELRAVSCASADKFVSLGTEKRSIAEQFGCDICDMESAGIVLTCTRNQVDCLLVKAVSDSVDGGAEEFGKMVEHSAQICMNILMGILENIA